MSDSHDDHQTRGRRSLYEAAHKLPYEPAPSGEEPAGAARRPSQAAQTPTAVAPRPWESVPEADESEPADRAEEEERDVVLHAGRLVLALGALGVVYGDIGTSPLYTMQATLGYKAASQVDLTSVYGIVSLIFWAITIEVSIKYAGFIMRAHNRGDGGIMALAALVRRRRVPHTVALVTLGIFGASLFFGDGIITPAISVLSAVSGLEVPAPGLAHLVVPISVAILIALFALQRKGTGTVGRLFGPVMLGWFAVLAVLGLREVLLHPGVLQALSPVWGVRFFTNHGGEAFLALGGVVLAVTGAEALYADRGHFGAGPIRMAWFAVVLPGVLLSYLGQAALVISHPADKRNPFFLLAPGWSQVPMVILATVATIIASQAVISGSYSVARQAMQLGYLPRLRIIHTSRLEGQVYVPIVNWLLGAGVIALVLAFQNSNGLTHAYGVAVTGTFVLNTLLFLAIARGIWRIARWRLFALGALFLTVELAFFLSNVAKILDGAWIPLVAGLLISLVMLVWNRGRAVVTTNRAAKEGSLKAFLTEMAEADPPVRRVPGTGIFLNPGRDTTPLALRAVLGNMHAVQEKVLIVSVEEVSLPYVDDHHRFTVERIGPQELALRHVRVRVGYQEQPNVPERLRAARRELLLERDLDLERATYYVSRITLVAGEHSPLSRWQQKLFMGVARNAATAIEAFGLPSDRTIAIGAQIPT